MPLGPARPPVRPRTERVLPLHRPWRWVATAAVLVLLAQAGHGLLTNPFYQWGRFAYWFTRPVFVDGLLITLQVAAYSTVLGFIGGIALALGRLSSNPVLRAASWVYIWLFRSVPLIVVLLFLYNFSALYPTLSVGVPFGPAFFTCDESRLAADIVVAVVGLTLCEAAYAAEVVRSGLLSVDWTEISAVCTHPEHRGGGLATRLVRAVAAGIRDRGDVPFLHTTESNTSAIRLYESLGFTLRRRTSFLSVRVPG
ncbi:ABC transporter permease subunit [Streptomyces sp. H34-S4]|nr:ABC transporter permease subunit [Streptomyces sp. H34-S4]MCY0938221.1 ABC transporter permease subunit [Streptomyces sp. H34-S4]